MEFFIIKINKLKLQILSQTVSFRKMSQNEMNYITKQFLKLIIFLFSV